MFICKKRCSNYLSRNILQIKPFTSYMYLQPCHISAVCIFLLFSNIISSVEKLFLDRLGNADLPQLGITGLLLQNKIMQIHLL